MQHFIFIGLPGAGKTYAGKLFAEKLGFEFYDGDKDLPEDMIQALHNHEIITDEMRDRFMERMIEKFTTLTQTHEKVILSQTFLQNRHRQLFAQAFPHAHFVLVRAPDDIREKRYEKRKDFSFTIEYLRKMSKRFEDITVPYDVLVNMEDGDDELLKQFELLLSQKDN